VFGVGVRVRVRVRVGVGVRARVGVRVSTRVDDAHGHAVLDRVVEEDGVDGLAQRGEAAEAEGEVGDAARDLG